MTTSTQHATSINTTKNRCDHKRTRSSGCDQPRTSPEYPTSGNITFKQEENIKPPMPIDAYLHIVGCFFRFRWTTA